MQIKYKLNDNENDNMKKIMKLKQQKNNVQFKKK